MLSCVFMQPIASVATAAIHAVQRIMGLVRSEVSVEDDHFRYFSTVGPWTCSIFIAVSLWDVCIHERTGNGVLRTPEYSSGVEYIIVLL